jgi:superkiller protein 3
VHQRTLTREWINIGLELSTQGRYSEALEAFNKVLADDNTNTIALTSKALAYLELNKFDVALECCERVLEFDESSVFALKAAGAARCNLGRYEEAMENFKQARKLEPNVVAKYFWEDVSTYMRNCGPSIVGFWHHALKDFPTEPHLYLLIANSYLTAGNFTGAKEYASRAVEMDPTYAQYQLAISQAEFGLENWKAAALALDNVIGLGTINHMEHVWLGKVEAEQHLGNYEEMERVLYQAFERSETTEFLLQKAVDVAKKYYADNQTERAIKFLEKIVSYKSNTFDDAVHMLTSIYVDVDRKHDAVTLLRRLHEKHPSNTILMYNLAVFLEPAEAFPYLEQVVQSVDVVPMMWKALGEVYYRLKQYEKAVDALDKGMVADDSLFWHRIKAECHSHLRQWDKEYQAMRRVYDLIPDGPAEYLYIRGEYEKALLLVDEAIAKQPDASKFSSRATLLKEMGRQEEALEAIDKAAELEPDPFQIYQKIDILGTLSRFDEAYALVKQAEATLSESVDEKYVLHNLLLSVLLRRQGKYDESLVCA